MVGRILAATALLVLGGTLSAISTQAFPSTYAASHSYSYDAATGSAGTLYITVTITGHMTIPSCPSQYLHTPSAAIKLPNGTWTQRVSGTPVNACTDMAYSHVFTIDVASAGCPNFPENSQTCSFTSEPEIMCPIMGIFFDDPSLFGIEWAWTRVAVTQCVDIGVGNVECKASYYCQNGSAPPDFQPTQINSYNGQYTAATFPPFMLTGSVGFRIPNSYGVLWQWPGTVLISVIPGSGQWKQFLSPAVAWNNSPFTCTNYDKDLGSIIPWPF